MAIAVAGQHPARAARRAAPSGGGTYAMSDIRPLAQPFGPGGLNLSDIAAAAAADGAV